ncbi:hypothetical protein [Marinimicrobium sp. ABcell2]|uniref:hypothetical protein n=1 Tax=Marinimicrobium sp. ABcell2 TaxID=3069751 RepID=UPI0027AF9FFD|nr:hypothetical protein [Marinimicrobium sp. ABcell2]MDQ2076965.1 hypothetical protein [Marinimicrobium sp. ABcell2]
MMRRIALLAVVLVVSACARAPSMPVGTDLCPAPAAKTGLLRVTSEQGRQNLVVHRETSSDYVTFVALDAVGAPQFTARQRGDQLTVEQSPLYRGVDPQWLLWGWQWWQLRDELSPACVEAAGYTLKPVSEGGYQLSSKDRPHWRWQSTQANQYELPQQQAKVTVREVETNNE